MMFRLLVRTTAVCLLLTAVTACGGEAAEAPADKAAPSIKKYAVPKFDRDSAYQFVAKQVAFGPRVPNSEAHQACKVWLVDQFKRFGATVIEQDFKAEAYTGELLNGTNIIAQYNPAVRKRILLAAHWDSRHIADSPLSTEQRDQPILGADDGGSGVGVLLEIARQLQENPIDMGVDLILFDLEDYGESKEQYANQEEQLASVTTWALGSQHWAQNLHVSGYRPKYGILLDMVGAEGARFPKEEWSMRFAPSVVNKVWTLAGNMGYGSYFADVKSGGVTDDHYFVNTLAKIPMIDIINLPPNSDNKGFGSHWHTQNDNLEVINARTLRAVGQVVLAVIYREASGTF
ncbi:MAG: M28 family peptidase [Bacteroidota bacterium]